MPKFIGVKQLFYCDVITEDLKTVNDVLKYLPGGASATTAHSAEVENVHQDTWGYRQADPGTTEYKNELTGENYFVDVNERGTKTINFTMGEYEYAHKAALQGGEVIESGGKAVGWKASGKLDIVHKAIIALTKTNTYIVFTNANIIAKGDQQQKAVGLGVTATAEENPNTYTEGEGASAVTKHVEDEYWFDAPTA